MSRSLHGYTGGMFEADFLYRADDPRYKALRHTDAQHAQNLEAIRIDHGKHTFANQIQALLRGEDCGYLEHEQSNPPTPIANDVHAHIVKLLEVEDFGYDTVRFLPCVNSTLDTKGVDLVVAFTDPRTKRECFVTVDFTVNTRKVDEHKYSADVLITPNGAESQRFHICEYIDDIEKSTKEEERALKEQRRFAMADVIAAVIQKRLQLKRGPMPSRPQQRTHSS